MNHAMAGLVFAFAALSGASAADLEGRILAEDGWVAWQVPMVADVDAPCCFSVRRGRATQVGCDLDGRDWSFGTDSRHPLRDGTLSIHAHVVAHRLERVRAVAASCPVSSAAPIRDLGAVDARESLGLLAAWAEKPAKAREDDSLLAAIGYHADPAATPALARLAAAGHPQEWRGQALFWLGQLRGADGAQAVERYAATDPDPDLREKAVFALSQSRAGDPYARILGIARTDAAGHVRSQALFWMAQMEDARAAKDIAGALASERSEDVREQAVFALSQLPEGQAEDALIAVVRGDFPREAKKQALFWLGESGSPKAVEALDAVLASH